MFSVEELRRKHLLNTPPWEADTLLRFAAGKTKEYILTHPEHRLSFRQLLRFYFALFLFKRGYPLAYIIHNKEFYGLDFYVDRRVLTPRPETELLVESAIQILKNKTNEPVLFADIGTGSGCIPISVSKNIENKNIDIIATDISPLALMVAEKNASKHKVNIIFLNGNLLEPLDKLLWLGSKYSELVITANLPYGWSEWKNNYSIESRSLKFEPGLALFTGKKGLQLYEEFFIGLKNLSLPFTVLLEFDPRQTELLSKLITEILPKVKFEIKKDLAGRDRLAIITSHAELASAST